MKMSKFEYDFLTDAWISPRGAAYNQVYEFCQEFGWVSGFDNRRPVLTQKGLEAVKAYQANENYNRIDVI
jgi:hypothetical protein